MKKLIFLPLLFLFFFCFSQKKKSDSILRSVNVKMYPSNWWLGMKNPHLQVMVRGKNFGLGKVLFDPKENPDIKLDSIQKVKNPNFLFLNFTIGPNAKPGNLKFTIHTLDTWVVTASVVNTHIENNANHEKN